VARRAPLSRAAGARARPRSACPSARRPRSGAARALRSCAPPRPRARPAGLRRPPAPRARPPPAERLCPRFPRPAPRPCPARAPLQAPNGNWAGTTNNFTGRINHHGPGRPFKDGFAGGQAAATEAAGAATAAAEDAVEQVGAPALGRRGAN
jgi:hypothetical protein